MNEQELITKYKTVGIVKGTLRKGKGAHKGKNVVAVICKKCKHKMPAVATSDLFIKCCNECGEKLNRTRNQRAILASYMGRTRKAVAK